MNSALAPLALAVPLVAAALCSMLGSRVPRVVLCIVALAAVVFETVACSVLAFDVAAHGTILHCFGGWQPRHGISLGIVFVVDPVAAALATIAGFLTTMAFVFAWTFYDDDDGAFHALMLVFNAALVGFFFTGDLFNLFVFFELMSVSAYALTGYKSEDGSAVQGALTFAVVNSTGALMTLTGIALIYARTGALTMAQIAHALGTGSDPLVVMAFALIAIGFLTKGAVVPFHFWLSEAHAVAPTPLCALFSGIMVEAGLYGVARVYWSVFSSALGTHAHATGSVLLTIGIVTAFVGAIMCFAQRHLKRLLAFSTIAHSGIMLCAIALLRADALGGFLVYVFGHALLKGGLFLCSGIVLNRYRTVDVEALRGRLRDLPWLGIAFVVGAFGLAGLPPFGTFLGKSLIDDAAAAAGTPWLGPLLLVASALTGAALLKSVGCMSLGWGPPPDPGAVVPQIDEPETSLARGSRLFVMASAAFVLLALAAAAGIAPLLGSVAIRAAQRFVNLPSQESIVLALRASHALLPRSAPLDAASPDFAIGFVSAYVAAAIAAYALFAHRLATWPRLRRAYELAMRLPHAWHSGIVTDYIAWLVTGSALFGAAMLAFAR